MLFNVFKLVGLVPARAGRGPQTDELLRQPEAAFKDLAVYPERCGRGCAANCSHTASPCRLCRVCLDTATHQVLWQAFREHKDRHSCRRVVPPTLVRPSLARPSFSIPFSKIGFK